MRGTAKGGKENLGGKRRATARRGERAIVGHGKGATDLGERKEAKAIQQEELIGGIGKGGGEGDSIAD